MSKAYTNKQRLTRAFQQCTEGVRDSIGKPYWQTSIPNTFLIKVVSRPGIKEWDRRDLGQYILLVPAPHIRGNNGTVIIVTLALIITTLDNFRGHYDSFRHF